MRELKNELTALGIDFSGCCEKSELEALLTEALDQEEGQQQQPEKQEGSAKPEDSDVQENAMSQELHDSSQEEEEDPFEDGGFATRRRDGKCCWVEFVTEGDSLCHWDDGSSGIVPASELVPISEDALQWPKSFSDVSLEAAQVAACSGSFEAARYEAFHSNKLLVASVRKEPSCTTIAERRQALVLTSPDVASLIQENAIFWKGAGSELRATHLQQLAPNGAPSFAMVLPLAADAMRVLSHSDGTDKDVVVGAFVDALEALQTHQEAKESRLYCSEAQLRFDQDEEFAAALAADQAAEAERLMKETAELEHPAKEAETDDSMKPGSDSPKRPGHSPDPDAGERLAKSRRVLADQFLAKMPPPDGSKLARLVLRLPTGERVERAFGADECLARVHDWAACCALLPEAKERSLQIPTKFELRTAFPPRKLGEDDAERTLAELGLTPNAALLLISLDEDES